MITIPAKTDIFQAIIAPAKRMITQLQDKGQIIGREITQKINTIAIPQLHST
jgi:hypothetical protein